MRTCYILAILAIASSAPAQSHTTGHVLLGIPFLSYRSPQGSVVTLVLNSALPNTRIPERGMMDVDNAGHVLAVNDSVRGAWIVRIDAAQNISTVQLQNIPFIGPKARDVMLDQDGRYRVLMSPYPITNQPTTIYEIDPAIGTVTTAVRLPTVTAPMSFTRDTETGDLYVIEGGNPAPSGRILRLAPGGAVTSVVTLSPITPFVPMSMAVDPAAGDVYCSSADGVLRWRPTGGVTTILTTPYFATQALFADRASSTTPRLVGAICNAWPGRSHVYALDLATKSVTTLWTDAALGSARHLFVHQSRNVASMKTGSGRWDVRISFPTEPGSAFVSALGLSGTRRGPMLGNRRLPLNIDALSGAALNDALRPYWTGGIGRLTAVGRARAVLDVSALPGLSGVRLWIVVATLDPAAPLGVRTIADPLLIVL